jgi:hypothetical protein
MSMNRKVLEISVHIIHKTSKHIIYINDIPNVWFFKMLGILYFEIRKISM